jgi:hypothetical protein
MMPNVSRCEREYLQEEGSRYQDGATNGQISDCSVWIETQIMSNGYGTKNE